MNKDSKQIDGFFYDPKKFIIRDDEDFEQLMFEEGKFDFIYRQYYKFTKFIRSVKRYIRNALKYRKVLSKDENWDYCYLLELIRQKLIFMCDYEIKYGHTDDKMEQVEQMQECITLLDKIVEDDYNNVEKREQAKDELFELLKKHIFYWWD